MNYSELIQLYFERSNSLQWLWTLYVVIIGGLLAFSSLRVRKNLITTILITILFSFFAYKNLGGIHDVTIQRLATLQAIQQYHLTSPEEANLREVLEPTLQPPQYEGVRNFHVTSDVLTILALWAMERRRNKIAQDDK